MISPIVTPNAALGRVHFSCGVVYRGHFTIGMAIHAGAVREKDVNSHFDQLRAVEERHSAPCRYYLFGALGPNTSMDAVARGAFSKFFEAPERDSNVSALIESDVHRGVITALKWIGVKITAWHWNHAHEALGNLNLPRAVVGEEEAILSFFKGLAVFTGVDSKPWSRW